MIESNRVGEAWKVPFREVYCDSFVGMLKQTLWCHVVGRVFPGARDLAADVLSSHYFADPSAFFEQYKRALRRPQCSSCGEQVPLGTEARKVWVRRYPNPNAEYWLCPDCVQMEPLPEREAALGICTQCHLVPKKEGGWTVCSDCLRKLLECGTCGKLPEMVTGDVCAECGTAASRTATPSAAQVPMEFKDAQTAPQDVSCPGSGHPPFGASICHVCPSCSAHGLVNQNGVMAEHPRGGAPKTMRLGFLGTEDEHLRHLAAEILGYVLVDPAMASAPNAFKVVSVIRKVLGDETHRRHAAELLRTRTLAGGPTNGTQSRCHLCGEDVPPNARGGRDLGEFPAFPVDSRFCDPCVVSIGVANYEAK